MIGYEIKIVECHSLLVVIHKELILLVLVPRSLYRQVYHAAVLFHRLTHLLGNSVQTVIVIANDLNSV